MAEDRMPRGARLLLGWAEINLTSARTAAVSDLIGFYRAYLQYFRGSASVRTRLMRGLCGSPGWWHRRAAEVWLQARQEPARCGVPFKRYDRWHFVSKTSGYCWRNHCKATIATHTL